MIKKFAVSRDDNVYQAWPDLALTRSGVLVCVFAECTHHGDRSYTRIMFARSEDRGRNWSDKQALSEPLHKRVQGDLHWNCPRITALADGRLVVVVDQIGGEREGNSPSARQINQLFFSEDDGCSWQGPVRTPAVGIVPDRLIELRHGPHCGRWLLSAHRFELLEPKEENGSATERWSQRLWYSDDKGQTWQGPVTIAQSDSLRVCEGSILELATGELVCFMRENSFTGIDCQKAISRDQGLSWEGLYVMPMPACHRPVAGLLQSGNVLIGHRYLPGGKGGWGAWTQNLFMTLTDVDGALATERSEVMTRVLPLDHDRSRHADTGYCGWVQFADGEIYCVNYLLDDAPKAQIRGYSLREEDIWLPEG